MNAIRKPTRRGVLGTASAALGAFTFGFHIPGPRGAAGPDRGPARYPAARWCPLSGPVRPATRPRRAAR